MLLFEDNKRLHDKLIEMHQRVLELEQDSSDDDEPQTAMPALSVPSAPSSPMSPMGAANTTGSSFNLGASAEPTSPTGGYYAEKKARKKEKREWEVGGVCDSEP